MNTITTSVHCCIYFTCLYPFPCKLWWTNRVLYKSQWLQGYVRATDTWHNLRAPSQPLKSNYKGSQKKPAALKQSSPGSLDLCEDSPEWLSSWDIRTSLIIGPHTGAESLLSEQKGCLFRPTHPSLKAFISEVMPGRAYLVPSRKAKRRKRPLLTSSVFQYATFNCSAVKSL